MSEFTSTPVEPPEDNGESPEAAVRETALFETSMHESSPSDSAVAAASCETSEPGGLTPGERHARFVWAHIAEPRDVKAHALIDTLGYEGALAEVEADARSWENFAARLDALDVDEQHRRLGVLGVRVLMPGDDEWPETLEELPESPHTLFVVGEGHLASAAERSVALVGARAATHYGQRMAAQLALGVGAHGVSVVSGGAFGIDAAAHRGALAGDADTICVVAGGVDRVYPSAHEELFARIRENGVIVSEMPLGFAPMRQRFLHRNRLIAALSPGTVVVEAGLRSGSLSTARRAEELNRLVGAVPGPVTSAASAGCHELIRDGAAVLVTGADDVMELVGSYGPRATTRDSMPALVRPEDAVGHRARVVWDALPLRRPASVEHVARVCGRPEREVVSGLGELLAAGLATREDGGWRKA